MLTQTKSLDVAMPETDKPEIEILKSFEAPIADIPERPVDPPRDLPLEDLVVLAEEAYRALDA